jgi:hypothetical protein
MPRYRDVWGDEPKAYRDSVPMHVQQQLDQRVAELLEDPHTRATFFPGLERDHWITSFGPNLEGSIMYSVRDEPIPTVGILRVSYMGPLT